MSLCYSLPMGLLDPSTLSRIASLDLVARRIVEGTMVGLHESHAFGPGAEFAQYRPYIPGDDMRALDWRVFARTDRYYVRQHVAETNLHAWLLVDASASMGFGTGEVAKLRVATMLAAALAYLYVKQGDRVGLAVVGGTAVEAVPTRGGERHLHVLLHALERLVAGGAGSVAGALDVALGHLRRRGPVAVFSDLYEPASAVGDAVARLARAGFDVSLFHVLDPVERTLDLDAETEFVGLEEGGRVTADPRRLRRHYLARLGEHVSALRAACAGAGADFVEVDTAAPLDETLARFLRARAARAAGPRR
jgi:uncharacterized protein (DUF58 family)